MDVKEAIALIGLVGSVTGHFLTATQMRRTARTARATFFKDLYAPFFLDERIRYAYQLLDDAPDLFRPTLVPNGGRALEATEHHFEYNIQRVCRAPGFDEYLEMLQHWQESKRLSAGPYASLRRYVRENRSWLPSEGNERGHGLASA